ncbi:FG-GAP repeat domain-containing protein [Portibacter marinus]|uniref:FG-GAP repeat domain-containing protein n=1 Tax=Portibacter marinus TaxID=2898660 RepID=UPI001F17298B|nr:VCBS repeat-containing protein [Portibacter marinus]
MRNCNSLFFLVMVLVISCEKEAKLDSWKLNLPIIGSNSSPKCVDLNQDGVLDIVLGAGRNEFQDCRMGVIAVNGASGDTLWTAPSTDQMYGSPIFQDINGDETPDVIISGRDLNLYALDGNNGHRIWKYEKASDEYSPEGLARFNFYNPIFIDDQNNDDLQDILILNSGNVNAAPYDSLNRYPGVLLVLNSYNGNILHLDTMPDGKESYMSPVLYDFDHDGNQTLIFGTGGETISGNLFRVELDDFLESGLQSAKLLRSYNNQHGFIAPPLIADFNNDGYKDLLAINHGGSICLFDGQNDLALSWEKNLEGVELNAQATVGYFNSDENLDIFISGALGQWPRNTGSKQYFLDGKTGEIDKTYEIGCSGFSSPLSMNIDEDPQDEALLYINDFDCRRYNTTYNLVSLYIFDLDTISIFAETSGFGKNISSTPWIGDLDGDNNLDLVSIIAENTRIFHEFLGFNVIRNEYHYNPNDKIKWSSYMEENNRCIYED